MIRPECRCLVGPVYRYCTAVSRCSSAGNGHDPTAGSARLAPARWPLAATFSLRFVRDVLEVSTRDEPENLTV